MMLIRKFVPTAAVEADSAVLAAASMVAAALGSICLGRVTFKIVERILLPFFDLNYDRSSISMISSGLSP